MSRQRIAVTSVVLLCMVGLARAAVPDPDVGWWKFDEGTGDTTADSSGKGNTGAIQGATWLEGGWNGLDWCLDFDGNDDRVELGPVDVQGAGITLAAWIEPDNFNINDCRMISKANEWGENDHWWMLSTINKSFLRFRLKTQGQGTTTLIASQGEIILGEWQHAAATWDGARMRLYRNAVEVASVAKGGAAVATNPGVKAAIGSQPKGAYLTDPLHANKFFDGRIDEVRIYSYALSAAQMQELIQGLHPTAWKPDPADGAEGVMQPLLLWSAADTGVLHDVYLGLSPELGPEDRVVSQTTDAFYWHAPLFEPGTTYYWRVDEIDVAGNLTPGKVWTFVSASVTAYRPQPANGAKWVDPQALTLEWSSGMDAIFHDVYFGTSAQDVAAGTGDTLKKSRQVPNTFDPGVLLPGVTYYWRIDEVLLGDNKNTGPVWSFTTAAPGGGLKGEYYGNPDLSGMPALVRIDPGVNFAWATAGPGQPLPTSGYSVRWSGELEAAFAETYTIAVHADDGVRLWFNNELVVDKWFGQEAGSPSYMVKARLEAGHKYPIVMEYFFSAGSAVATLSWESPHTPSQIIPAGALTPPVRAASPMPPDGAVEVTQTPTLRWSAGDRAVEHEIYFGEDANEVATATVGRRQALDQTSFDPGPLEWSKTYYWRVDEVNDAHPDSPWIGAVWSFTTADFLVVDDFESYDNDVEAKTTIYDTWLDGLVKGNGSMVGYWDPPFAERVIIHGGRQSMPLEYNNVNTPWYSEAEREFSPLENWTLHEVNDLVVWFRGHPVRFLDQAGVITMSGSGHDIWDNADDFRFAWKRLNGNGSIIAKVESLVNTNNWAKAGVMIRQSLDPGSTFAYAIVSAAQGVSFGWRQLINDACGSATQAGVAAPQYVKLTRTGDIFTAQYSADGKTWTDVKNTDGTVASTTIVMSGSLYIGLCVTSHNTAATTTAVFSNVTPSAGVTGAWQVSEIGDDPQPANDPQGLYVRVTDATTARKSATVRHPDPAATTFTTWTEWKIPLSSFAGVSLNKVSALCLGVGDKVSPTPDGFGRIYIDDIRVVEPASQ